MPRGQIEERIRVTGGQQAQRELRDVAGATSQVGDATEKTSGSAGGLASVFGGLGGAVKSVIGGLMGVGAVTALWKTFREELEKTATAAADVAKSTASLYAMTGDVRDVNLVNTLRIRTGREASDIGAGVEEIRTGTVGRTRKEHVALAHEAAELARTRPGTSYSEIAGAFTKLANVEPDWNAQQIQNVIAKTTEAGQGLSPSLIGRFAPRIMGAAEMASIPADQAMGLWAFAATQTSQRGSGTAVEQFMTTLARPTGDAAKTLQRLGVDDMGGMAQISAMQRLWGEGKMSQADLTSMGLTGETGRFATGLLSRPGVANQTRMSVVMAGREGAPDLGRQQLNRMLSVDQFAYDERIRQAEQAEAVAEATDADALQMKAVEAEAKASARLKGRGMGKLADWTVGPAVAISGALGRDIEQDFGADFSNATAPGVTQTNINNHYHGNVYSGPDQVGVSDDRMGGVEAME